MFEEIKRLLVECANVSEDDIKPESHLKKDLGIDSLYAVELTLQLEEYYHISIDWEEMHDVVYVKDVVALVEKKVGSK
ncbi:MAG: acyl carrier protein [Acholeplasmatales bacterium]|nr:acyl carrier protein [Acholeplasmatales bacterium]